MGSKKPRFAWRLGAITGEFFSARSSRAANMPPIGRGVRPGENALPIPNRLQMRFKNAARSERFSRPNPGTPAGRKSPAIFHQVFEFVGIFLKRKNLQRKSLVGRDS